MNAPRLDPPTLEFARAARDGGIHAIAALDHALGKALEALPADHALSEERIRDLKRVFGNAMGEIMSSIVNPAIRAYPELEPSEAAWSAAAVEQARQLGLKKGTSSPRRRGPK